MTDGLRILLMTHHRRYRSRGRSMVIAEHLVKRGHQVTLCVTADKRRVGIVQEQRGNLNIVEIPDLLWGRLRSGWDVWNMIHRFGYLLSSNQKYDLVHVFETRPNTIYPALMISRKQDIPLITDWNDWFGRGGLIEVLRPKWYRLFFGGFETYFEEAFRRKADGLTVIASALAKRAIQLGVDEKKICIIHGGCDPDAYPARSKKECREHMNYPQDIPILGFCSSDSYLDAYSLIDTVAILTKDYPRLKLILTGVVKPEVLTYAKTRGVSSNLILPGYLPLAELSWCLGCADVFLLPFPPTVYNNGRWPNKIGLYMCQSRPIVSNAVGDLIPLFEHEQIGFAAGTAAEDFADKVGLLLNNPDVSSSMGANALRLAQTEYNWDNLTEKLEDFYTNILPQHRKAGAL